MTAFTSAPAHGDTRILVGGVLTVYGQDARVHGVLSGGGAQSTPITGSTATIDRGEGTRA